MKKTDRQKKQQYIRGLRYHCKKGKLDRNGELVEMRLDLLCLENLLSQAGISIWDVGRGRGKYCLGRIKDLGHYEEGNCRFITQEENGLEFWNNLSIEEQESRKQQAREDGAKGGEFGYLGGLNNGGGYQGTRN